MPAITRRNGCVKSKSMLRLPWRLTVEAKARTLLSRKPGIGFRNTKRNCWSTRQSLTFFRHALEFGGASSGISRKRARLE
ncbi:hypothetical protein JG688_00011868 [Phytophthora aleatoria]|uniref:Uncharacterized protein n=1 Tax=Phytophthora aleatoria TaxID=2496075 RepID=A0A8J5MEK0_9STRA|nr:hypothetical protein JG688_00011868 [Phytophthora aleatoria]